jgi:hypothetical protein
MNLSRRSHFLIIIFSIFITIYAVHVRNLVKESGFHRGAGAWGISKDMFPGGVGSFEPVPVALEPIEEENTNSIVFTKMDSPQGLFQAIFHDKSNNLHNINSPLLLSFQHQAHNINLNGIHLVFSVS